MIRRAVPEAAAFCGAVARAWMCDARRMRALPMSWPVQWALATLCWAAAPPVHARAEISGPQAEPTAIFDGTLAGACAWPSAVAVSSADTLCTGTLVHPQLVLFAAHCGEAIEQILILLRQHWQPTQAAPRQASIKEASA